jgi:drug/metabolite transporter (DMT)-like permease
MGIVLLSVLSNTGNILLDKYLLAKQKMKLGDYIPLLFVFLFLVTAISLPWTGAINNVLASSQQYVFYFILMVLLAIIWNIFYYQGLQQESILEFEMIMMLTPLVTVLMAVVFYPEEFNPTVFTAALIGSAALFMSHLRKHHFDFSKYAIHLLLAVVLIAMENMVQNELLSVYSPTLLYAIRTGLLALFFGIYFRPKMSAVTNRQFGLVFWGAVMGALGMIGKLYGYNEIGITFTTLILLLVPVLASWFDAWANKTPIKKRSIVAFVVILGCVIYATIFA